MEGCDAYDMAREIYRNHSLAGSILMPYEMTDSRRVIQETKRRRV